MEGSVVIASTGFFFHFFFSPKFFLCLSVVLFGWCTTTLRLAAARPTSSDGRNASETNTPLRLSESLSDSQKATYHRLMLCWIHLEAEAARESMMQKEYTYKCEVWIIISQMHTRICGVWCSPSTLCLSTTPSRVQIDSDEAPTNKRSAAMRHWRKISPSIYERDLVTNEKV